MDILIGFLAAGMLVCAALAIRANRLVLSSLWLAALSALLATLIYAMGATRIAVIELSVGAGLVTVLLVFAVGIAGDETGTARPVIPRFLPWALGLMTMILLGWLTVPLAIAPPPASQPTLATLLWRDRALDVVLQVALVFCGVMGVLGLLAEGAVAPAVEHKRTETAAPVVTAPVAPSPKPVTEQSEAKL